MSRILKTTSGHLGHVFEFVKRYCNIVFLKVSEINTIELVFTTSSIFQLFNVTILKNCNLSSVRQNLVGLGRDVAGLENLGSGFTLIDIFSFISVSKVNVN